MEGKTIYQSKDGTYERLNLISQGPDSSCYLVKRVPDNKHFVARVCPDPNKFKESLEQAAQLNGIKSRYIVGFVD